MATTTAHRLPPEILVCDTQTTADISALQSCRSYAPRCSSSSSDSNAEAKLAQQRLRKLLDEEQRRQRALDVEKEKEDDDDEDYLQIVQGIQSLCNHNRRKRQRYVQQRRERSSTTLSRDRPPARSTQTRARDDEEKPAAKESNHNVKTKDDRAAKESQPVAKRRALPKSFYCPLTSHVMVDPVVDHEGQSYERSAIESWLSSGRTTSPVSARTLKPYHLAPNRALKELIVEYMGPEWASLVEQSSALPPPRSASPDPPTPSSLAIVPASSTTQAVPTTITTTVANKTSTEPKQAKKRLRVTHASPHRTRVDDFLEEISRTSNLSERLNEHGVCAFMYGTLRIVIEVPDQGGTFMIYTTFNDLIPPAPRMSVCSDGVSSGSGSKEAMVVVVNPFSGEKETRALSDIKLDKGVSSKKEKKGAASKLKDKATSQRERMITAKKEKAASKQFKADQAKAARAEAERKEAANAELQKKLLRLNFMESHTKGGVLSMDPKHDNDVTYSLYGRVEGLHVSDFWATLETFIETALRLHSKLKSREEVEKGVEMGCGGEERSVRVSLGYEPTPRTQRSSSESGNDVEG